MKINMNETLYSGCTFLGGTCANSTWRQDLIAMLNDNVPYFDPQVPGWTPADRKREDDCKTVAKINVFVITGNALGTYSGWEIHEEATRNASKLVFCAVGSLPENQKSGIATIKENLVHMGAIVCESLEEVAEIVNAAYADK